MKLKRIIILTSIAVLLFGSAAYAQGRYKMAELFFERIHIMMNGQYVPLGKDSIFYEGSIYIPVRNLWEMLGGTVGWDDENRAVTLDFVMDHREALMSATKKGWYQYIAIENNAIMADFTANIKSGDTLGMRRNIERVEKLRQLAVNIQDSELSAILEKTKAALELLRSGIVAKNPEDQVIAISLYSSNSAKLNDLLRKELATDNTNLDIIHINPLDKPAMP